MDRHVSFMDGHTGGFSINGSHLMQQHGAPIVTARGIWGGTQSRLTVTDEGTFVTYTHRHDNENLVIDGVDGIAMHGRVAFLFKPASTQTWHLLYEWPDSVGSPVLASDKYGNVYVVSHMTQDGSHVPGSAESRATYRPWVGKYTAGTWTGSGDTTPIRHFVWDDMTETLSNSYTAIGFSQDGRIVLGTSGNAHTQSAPTQCGAIDLLVFCTVKSEWVDAARLYTQQRFSYKYINFDGDGNIEVVGHRNGHALEAGYPSPGGNDWVFDGFYYWKLDKNFFDGLQNNYPRTKIGGEQLTVVHPSLLRYARIICSTPVSLADANDYICLPRPSISNAGAGDTFWDCNGDIHMLYAKTYKGNDFNSALWHTVIRDGQILFGGPVMDTPGGVHSIFIKDASGSYYIFAIIGGTPSAKAQALLYKAANTADTGWAWEQVGVFLLPAPIASGAISQAFNAGMSGHGNKIQIMYAVRDPSTAAGSNANCWASMWIDLH